MQPTAGQAELTVKLTSFPEQVKKLDGGARSFVVDVGGLQVEAKISKKSWARFEKDTGEHELWMAILKAPVQLSKGGQLQFVRPSGVQVVPRKERPAKSETDANAESGAASKVAPAEAAPASVKAAAVPKPVPPSPPARTRKIVSHRFHPAGLKRIKTYRDPEIFGAP